jgi:hypothetical protein
LEEDGVSDTEQSNWVGYLQRLIWDDREFAQVVLAAAQLGIADLVKDGPQSTAVLAELSGTHEPSLYRVMRYLASRGIFVEGPDKRFSMTTLAEPLREDHPLSVRGFAVFCGREAYQRAWGGLADSIRTGEPAFERVYGKPFFNYLAEHSDMAQIFNEVMTRRTVSEATAIADGHDFPATGRSLTSAAAMAACWRRSWITIPIWSGCSSTRPRSSPGLTHTSTSTSPPAGCRPGRRPFRGGTRGWWRIPVEVHHS